MKHESSEKAHAHTSIKLNMGCDESKLSQEVRTSLERQEALNKGALPSDDDLLLSKFRSEAETLFIPKRYKEAGDWLFGHNEAG